MGQTIIKFPQPSWSKYNYGKVPVLYISGLCMLAAGLPLSLFLTSLSQFFLAGSFLLEGSPVEKFRRFLRNRPAVLIAGIWLIHVIGLLWTSDMQEGLKDIRIKLPLLLLPLFIAGTPFPGMKYLKLIFIVFVSAVFTGSIVSMSVLYGLTDRDIYDIRSIFIFNISHIRFALFTCLSIFLLVWLTFIQPARIIYKVSAALLILWFAGFLIIIESVTGIAILFIVSLVLLFIRLLKIRNPGLKIFLSVLLVVVPSFVIWKVKVLVEESLIRKPYVINTAEKTSKGNSYYFNLDQPLYENGYPVYIYVCHDELREAWNSRSSIMYDSLDRRGQNIKYTLIRFLASKGLRKDAEGVSQLSPEEIKLVERGVANVNFADLSSFKNRLRKIIWELDPESSGNNPGGHSVSQRIEFWKAATGIVRNHPWTGVGTGDMKPAYEAQYNSINTPLEKQFWLRAHNQFITIWVALGIFGLIYFLISLGYPLVLASHRNFLFIAFILIAMLSMISEDTLETQAGATFFALFFMLTPLAGKQKPA